MLSKTYFDFEARLGELNLQLGTKLLLSYLDLLTILANLRTHG
jgi:hypothetical protein